MAQEMRKGLAERDEEKAGQAVGKENKHFTPAALPGGLVRRSAEKGRVRGQNTEPGDW